MNVTGDPAQQSRATIFGHDYSYPSTSDPLNWNSYPNPGPGAFSIPPVTGYNLHVNSSPVLGNFSFTPSDKLPHPAQFNFSPPPNVCHQDHDYNRLPPLRCKRKTDSPPHQIVKQHITEEKMAEHMSKLHISSETISVPEPEPLREKRLYMCEEMRRLQTESILPQSILNRVQRPCTALVLWTPPPRIPPVQSVENNNEENEPDNNVMDLDCNM